MKRIAVFASLCLLLSALSGCGSAQEKSVFALIEESPAAKMLLPDGSTVFVDGEIAALQSFAELDIQASAMEPADGEEDWLYRIVFNPAEKVQGAGEIVVSFHEMYVQIGTEYYLPPEEVSYQSILEWAEGKFDYYME